MIKFNCSVCDNSMNVNEDKVGMRGKCPKCSSIITVPEQSENFLIFDENEIMCSDKDMQAFYDYIMNNHNDVVKKHTLTNDDILIIDLSTFEESDRSQIVTCSCIEESDYFPNKQFLFTSQVGDIYNEDGLAYALLLSHDYPFLNIAMDDKDNMISVRSCFDININKSLLFSNMIVVALSADLLEHKLFGWDRK